MSAADPQKWVQVCEHAEASIQTDVITPHLLKTTVRLQPGQKIQLMGHMLEEKFKPNTIIPWIAKTLRAQFVRYAVMHPDNPLIHPGRRE